MMPAETAPASPPAFLEDSAALPLRALLPVLQRRIMEENRYFGIPAYKNPLDLWIYQEILFERRPDVVIEIGNARGGSTLALAHLCDLLGHGRVIAVDLSHAEVAEAAKKHPRITWIEGDACASLQKVRSLVGADERALVIEDSSHTFENTLNVLRAYAPLLRAGDYFILEDTLCGHGLDIGPRPGAFEAVERFLSEEPSFEADRRRESFLVTWNPKGFLRKAGA